jgi:mannose PTS system EIID component
MRKLPATVVRRMFLRSFTIQGSWNYRTLQGSGFAFALMPLLRWVHGSDDAALQAAVQRHATVFNAHPYLAGVALGAVARLEAEGEDPALIERFKNALRGSLGTLGDRIVWAGWRPACVLLGIAVLLATHSATWAVLAFLVVYNLGHLGLRWWGLQIGLEYGLQVGERLRRAPLAHWHEGVVGGAALLLGLTLPLVAAGGLTASRLALPWMLVSAGGVVAGWRFGAAIRLPALLLLAAATVAGFLIRLVP